MARAGPEKAHLRLIAHSLLNERHVFALTRRQEFARIQFFGKLFCCFSMFAYFNYANC